MGRRFSLVFNMNDISSRVTTRERGVIPGCYPRDIQYYHTKADDPGEWLNYLCPNAARLPVSDRLVAVRTQKRRLIMVD